MLLCKNTNIPAIGFAIQNKCRIMTTVCQQILGVSKIFGMFQIIFHQVKTKLTKFKPDALLI